MNMMLKRTGQINTSKRLPIVFCLDVSPSMGWKIGNNSSAIDLLNSAVNNFVNELNLDPKARASAEIAFVTFSSEIYMDTEFVSVGSLRVPKLKARRRGGTQMAGAILRSIEKIQNRRQELQNMGIPYYAPFLVLVTDGNPDHNDDGNMNLRAINMVRAHCDSNSGAQDIIIPFIVGVGDHIEPQTLNQYCAGFTKGYFPVHGVADKVQTQFNRVFKMISSSTKTSIHLNGRISETIRTIQADYDQILTELTGV